MTILVHLEINSLDNFYYPRKIENNVNLINLKNKDEKLQNLKIVKINSNDQVNVDQVNKFLNKIFNLDNLDKINLEISTKRKIESDKFN